MNVGTGELVTLLALAVVTWGLVIWALYDMFSRSADDFAAVGSNRTTWIVAMIVAAVLCGLGWVVALFYLISVRPRVQTVRPR